MTGTETSEFCCSGHVKDGVVVDIVNQKKGCTHLGELWCG